MQIGKLIPAVIHIFDTAPPTSPKHDENLEDFEEDEDPEPIDTKVFSEDDDDEEAAEHVDKSTLSEVTTTSSEDLGINVCRRSLVSEDDDAVLVAK